MYGKVESIKLLEHIGESLDYCEVVIDFDQLKIFGSYGELMDYVGLDVEYTTRKDVYNGQPIIAVNNLFKRGVVKTLEKEMDIKLLAKEPDPARAAITTFRIDGLKFGSTQYRVIAFLSNYTMASSTEAEWAMCKFLDSRSHVFTARCFYKSEKLEPGVSFEDMLDTCVGHYVIFDITSGKYGYQASDMDFFNAPVTLSSEVLTAESIIKQAVSGDADLDDYMTKFNYLEYMKGVIDGELGYTLVRIASEISMINALKNISDIYDYRELIRAAIVSRGYLLPSNNRFSNPVLNINKLMRTKLVSDRELLLLLDPLTEEEDSPTKRIYMEISKFVNKVINERRGENEKIDKASITSELRNVFGGLF